MGYCIELTGKNFKFKKDESENILNALKDFARSKNDIRWVYSKYILDSEDIKECFDQIRYPLFDDGDYYEIDYFSGEKLGDDEEIFNSIARCIEKGSYLEFVGEDGDMFRLVFDGEKCEYKTPTISWE